MTHFSRAVALHGDLCRIWLGYTCMTCRGGGNGEISQYKWSQGKPSTITNQPEAANQELSNLIHYSCCTCVSISIYICYQYTQQHAGVGPASEPQALPASKNSSLSFKISKIKSFFSIAASSHGQIWFSLSLSTSRKEYCQLFPRVNYCHVERGYWFGLERKV